jgi:glycosyltransferase involved in cell wall biosynthesis
MQINIIGPFPPPIGGISVHCARLLNSLQNKGYSVNFYDDYRIPKSPWYIRIRNILKSETVNSSELLEKEIDNLNYILLQKFSKLLISVIFSGKKEKIIVHFHKKNWKYRALLCLVSKFKPSIRIVLSIHSLRDRYEMLSLTDKIYLKFSIKNAACLIVMNDEIRNNLIKWGADPGKISIIPAFLPPEEKVSEIEIIPEDVWNFIKNRNPVISANAFMIRFYKGEDLYGLDMCVDLCRKLVNEYPDT